MADAAARTAAAAAPVFRFISLPLYRYHAGAPLSLPELGWIGMWTPVPSAEQLMDQFNGSTALHTCGRTDAREGLVFRHIAL
jgi:hypothetical protein